MRWWSTDFLPGRYGMVPYGTVWYEMVHRGVPTFTSRLSSINQYCTLNVASPYRYRYRRESESKSKDGGWWTWMLVVLVVMVMVVVIRQLVELTQI